MSKLIFIACISLALFGCGDSNNQPKPLGQSQQQDKNNNKPESTTQNTTSPGY